MSQLTPKDLTPGAYWYIVPGRPAAICEKRDGEDFVRFTNGGRQSWIKPGEEFDGPIHSPSQRFELGQEVTITGAVMGFVVWHDGEKPGGGKPQLYQHYDDAVKHAAEYLPGKTQITPIVMPTMKL